MTHRSFLFPSTATLIVVEIKYDGGDDDDDVDDCILFMFGWPGYYISLQFHLLSDVAFLLSVSLDESWCQNHNTLSAFWYDFDIHGLQTYTKLLHKIIHYINE